MRKALLITFCLVCVLSAAVLAGNNPYAKVIIHVRPHNAKLGCDMGTVTICSDITVTEPGADFDAFPVFFDLNEYNGCEYGITWPDWTYPAAFNNCADFVIGTIVNPGDGASHAWTGCQYGACIPSYLWLYADGPGRICPTVFAGTGKIQVLDCAEGLDTPAIGCAGVFGETGDDPCNIAIEPTTWGGIKTLFD